MPLHLNLHHEIQQQELARRRDPLRIGFLVMLVVAVGFVGYYFWALECAHSVSIHYEGLEAQWSRLEKKYDAAKARETVLEDQIKAGDALTSNIDGRFYWAPILGDILQSVPRNVQVTSVNCQTLENNPKNVVTVAGLAGGLEPRKEAEAVRVALEKKLAANCHQVTSSFKELEDSDQFVTLDGHRLATATFSIQFDLLVREPAATPAPAPARKPKETAAE